MLEFREGLFFASRYFLDSFAIAKSAKLKTREIKYPPLLLQPHTIVPKAKSLNYFNVKTYLIDVYGPSGSCP